MKNQDSKINDTISLRLINVSLRYPVFNRSERSLKSAVHKKATGGTVKKSGRTTEIVALDDINLIIKKGERVGIIGHNGAGKTTLLKVISGIYRPQHGVFERNGTLAAVINPANGLTPTLTGYENIENLGLLAGLSYSDVQKFIPEIEEFTQLGDYLDFPVSTYSTGMMTRLAFAISTALSPQILVADENLATGDAHFYEKARKRMWAMMQRSETLIIASHSLSRLPKLVDRGLLLHQGRIVQDGPIEDIIAHYNDLSTPKPVLTTDVENNKTSTNEEIVRKAS